jgi:hypothetical protein
MKKKLFDRSALQRVVRKRSAPDAGTADRLRYAMLGLQLWELYGSSFMYGWWLRLDEMADDLEPWGAGQLAPLCVFACDAGGLWGAAAVLRCDEGGERVPESGTALLLEAAGIAYIRVPVSGIDRGYLKSEAFAAEVQRAVMTAAGAQIDRPGSTTQEEQFTSDPRPIYPPRSRSLRDRS